MGNLRVYGNADARTDRAMRPGRQHNYMLTVVLSFSMAGHMGVPCIILPQKSAKGITIDDDIPSMYPYLALASTENAFITTKVFVEYCETLRRLVGHYEPLILLSDGHSSRTQAPVVAYLASINIHLFLLPSNTSHALSPNDQWHQRLSARRHAIGWRMMKSHDTRVRSQSEELRVLLEAIHSLRHDHKMLRAAFSHAGIDIDERTVGKMLNPPPTRRSASGTRTQSGGSQTSWPSPPTTDPAPPSSPYRPDDDQARTQEKFAAWEARTVSLLEENSMLRQQLKSQKRRVTERVQRAMVGARIDAVDEQMKRKRVSLKKLSGLMTMDAAKEQLLEKQQRRTQVAHRQRRMDLRTDREAPVREQLGLGADGRLTVNLMLDRLRIDGVRYTGPKSRERVLQALADHLGIVLAAEPHGDSEEGDLGADSEYAGDREATADWSKDDDAVVAIELLGDAAASEASGKFGDLMVLMPTPCNSLLDSILAQTDDTVFLEGIYWPAPVKQAAETEEEWFSRASAPNNHRMKELADTRSLELQAYWSDMCASVAQSL